jgi:hypothetical protein
MVVIHWALLAALALVPLVMACVLCMNDVGSVERSCPALHTLIVFGWRAGCLFLSALGLTMTAYAGLATAVGSAVGSQ